VIKFKTDYKTWIAELGDILSANTLSYMVT